MEWVQLGTVGEWLSGVGTLAAVLIALRIAHRDWKHAAEERQDSEAGQARLIIVTTSSDNPKYPSKWTVRVTNHSREPALSVELKGIERGGKPRGETLWSLTGTKVTTVVDVLAAGESVVWAGQLSKDDQPVLAWPLEVEIRFTDYRGRLWRRINREQPERILVTQL